MSCRLVVVVLVAAYAAAIWWLLVDYAPHIALLGSTLVPTFPFRCADCESDLHVGRRKRRRVPRLGGKLRVVCVECADRIDAQATLILNVPERRPERVA